MFGFKPVYRDLTDPALVFEYESLDDVVSDGRQIAKINRAMRGNFVNSGPGMDDLKTLLLAYFDGVAATYGEHTIEAAWMSGGSVAALEIEPAWVFRRLSRLGERMESWTRSGQDRRGIRLS